MNPAHDEDADRARDRIAEAYDSPPWWYDLRGFLILTFAYNSTLTHQVRFFGTHMGREHLEAACGTGTLLELVLRWRAWKKLSPVHVTAFDYAEPMLAGARARFRRTPGVTVAHADVSALPYENGAFDTASIANSLHCFPDVRSGLRELHRVLKPGGTLTANALLFPRGRWPLRSIAQRINDWGMRKGILYSPFEAPQVRQAFDEAGFIVEQVAVTGNCCDIVARKPRVRST